MTVWFTSDLHLGHRHVAELRGYFTTECHDDAIFRGWQLLVREHDQVWVLGDLAASSPDYALDLIAQLPGDKHLVTGNHDRCHPMHRDAYKHQARYLEVLKSVQPFARRRIGLDEVLLSHFPYSGDHTDADRYTQYRLRDEGLWLLHGHTHDAYVQLHGHEVHVGVDAWNLAPVSLETVAALMMQGAEDR